MNASGQQLALLTATRFLKAIMQVTPVGRLGDYGCIMPYPNHASCARWQSDRSLVGAIDADVLKHEV